MKEEKDNISEWMYFLGIVAIVGVFIITITMAPSHEKVSLPQSVMIKSETLGLGPCGKITASAIEVIDPNCGE